MVRKTKGLSVTVIVVFLALVSAPAQGAVVVDIQLDLLGGDAFYAIPGTVYDSELFLDEDNSTDPCKVIGQIRLSGEGSYDYEIRGGSIQLTPAELGADTSYGAGIHITKHARADFLAGVATLTVTGSIWQVDEYGIAEYGGYGAGGTILEAIVNYDFTAEEPGVNTVLFQLDLTITDGELYNGASAGWKMVQKRIFGDTNLAFCSQVGKPGVEDFTSDIGYGQGSLLITPNSEIPEPLSLGLLGLGGLMTLRRRRRR